MGGKNARRSVESPCELISFLSLARGHSTECSQALVAVERPHLSRVALARNPVEPSRVDVNEASPHGRDVRKQ